MPKSLKKTVLTQELLRVMIRCSPLLEWPRVREHLNGMMRRLVFRVRPEVQSTSIDVQEEKMRKKESWFRGGGAETVIFVPNTPGSELKKTYEEEVMKLKLR